MRVWVGHGRERLEAGEPPAPERWVKMAAGHRVTRLHQLGEPLQGRQDLDLLAAGPRRQRAPVQRGQQPAIHAACGRLQEEELEK